VIPSMVERTAAGGLRRWRRDGVVQLICLPPAGGSSMSFAPLVPELPADWSVAAVDPPGHGGQPGEPLREVAALASAAARTLAFPGGPLFLLGHSLGGMVALRLAMSGRLRLDGLILCGLPPPARIARTRVVSDIHAADEEILGQLARLGGVPSEVMESPEIISYFLPPLRADLVAYAAETREWAGGRFTGLPDVPVLVVAGEEDPLAPPHFMPEWAAVGPRVRTEVVAGGHFFPQRNAAALVRLLTSFAGARRGYGEEPAQGSRHDA